MRIITGAMLACLTAAPIIGALLPLATPAQAEYNTLVLLRISGDPQTTGRMLSLHVSEEPDASGVTIRAFATDGTSPITKMEILGNNVVIATCLGDKGCNYLWPTAQMKVGNNEVSMVYTRADKKRYQTYGRIGKPVKTTNFLLCGAEPCTDDGGNRLLAS